jgi:hypothetical protein
MKKIFFILIIFITTIFKSIAQIPNSGFENWTTVGSYQNPDGWSTMNNTTSASGIFTATKGTPGDQGTAYLVLTSKKIASVVINGIAVSGVLDSITQLPRSGFAFDQRPQSLTGNWQHMIYGTSQGSVSAILTRWNNANAKRDTIAKAYQTLSGMAMGWANFTINFTYQNGNFPDTCIIVLKASGAIPSDYDYLWVDNLAFSGSVAGITENTIQGNVIKIFPNPALDYITLNINTGNNEERVLNIYNSLGVLVKFEILKQDQKQIFVGDLNNGVYIIEVKSHNWSEKQKIIIQK